METTFFCVAYIEKKYKTVGRILGRWSALLALGLAGCAVSPPPAPPSVVQIKPVPRPPKIGLALGGGAARGFAHIGVLQVLEEQGIKPDVIVGTSAGSLVATLYASGKTPTQLADMAMSMDESSITDWMFPGRSLLKGEALARYVRSATGNVQIENTRIPLGIVATDLNSGQPILFQRGDAGTAVRASSSVPGVFQPVKIGDREYVDGGLVSPIPVRYARQLGADVVIAVDISAIPEGQPTKGAIDILLQTFNIMGHSISQHELKDADVVMRPKLAGIGSADFSQRRLSILAGREAALMVLPQLKEKIAAKTR
ncbi:MAG: patatin-like phospholipase family protein [Burkholderiales bacterium]|nr:patatin-like phospholipase family protein [Burkholderiales bacterium]MDE2432187.1 patatin-like phospholipase family protein [Burkholderiales bacterium]